LNERARRERTDRPKPASAWPAAPDPPPSGLWVGIDVSQEHLDAAIVDGRGSVIRAAQRYSNDGPGIDALWAQSQEMAARLGQPLAYAMEASGVYHLSLLTFLVETGARVWSFNPILLQGERKSRIRKTKTDPIDAELIAQFARKEASRHGQAHWSEDDARLREYCRVRFRLVRRAADTKRQLHRDLDLLCPGLATRFHDLAQPSALALLRRLARITDPFRASVPEIEGVLRPFYSSPGLLRAQAERVHERLASARPPKALVKPLVWEVRHLLRQVELLVEQVEQIELRIEREMKSHERLALSVPGVGPITAAVITSELEDPHRFPHADAVRAFAGLDPSVYQSGKFRGDEMHISKRGSPHLREALYRAALAATQVNPACRELYQRLMARGKNHREALVAVSAKLLIQVWAVLRNGRPFEPPERYRVSTSSPTPLVGKDSNGNPAIA
jgi:transposase